MLGRSRPARRCGGTNNYFEFSQSHTRTVTRLTDKLLLGIPCLDMTRERGQHRDVVRILTRTVRRSECLLETCSFPSLLAGRLSRLSVRPSGSECEPPTDPGMWYSRLRLPTCCRQATNKIIKLKLITSKFSNLGPARISIMFYCFGTLSYYSGQSFLC